MGVQASASENERLCESVYTCTVYNDKIAPFWAWPPLAN